MAKGYKGAGMGRPKFEFTPERKRLFETLMGFPFATEIAICEAIGCGRSTLTAFIKENYDGLTFQQLKAQKFEGLKVKLAGKQYELAMKGSVPMAIWLGKQWLGQSDKIEQKNYNKDIESLTDDELDKKIKELEK